MIEIDYTNVSQDVVGYENGIDVDFEFANYSETIAAIIRRLTQEQNETNYKNRIKQAFYETDRLSEILEYAEMVKGKFENIIVIGSAQSISGIRALAEALQMPYWNSMDAENRNGFPKIHFVSNIDPDVINGLSSVRNIHKTLMIIVARQEPSPEIMSLFMIAKKRLEQEIGENYRMHMVVCVGSGASILRQLANQEGYKTFELSDNISGIFSLLSPCGLLPLALLGINIEEYINGVRTAFANMQNEDVRINESAKIALVHYLLSTQKGKKLSVLMPYSSRLRSLPYWCGQIKSDILSQTYDKNGNDVEIGQVPYNAIGCTDQYTLLQMFNHGLNNKLINIVKVANFDTDIQVPQIFDYTAAGYLGGKNLSELMDAEINAAKMTLVDHQRPNITMTIPEVSPYYLGQFMSFYIGAMIIQACLFNLDPFAFSNSDELLNYVYAQMGRHGYETTYQEMQKKMQKDKVMT